LSLASQRGWRDVVLLLLKHQSLFPPVILAIMTYRTKKEKGERRTLRHVGERDGSAAMQMGNRR
jgi:hypothetical protein